MVLPTKTATPNREAKTLNTYKHMLLGFAALQDRTDRPNLPRYLMSCACSDPANRRTSQIARIGQAMRYIIAFMRFDNLLDHIWPGALLKRAEPEDMTSL
jgi:hypothetical protein